MHLQHGLRDQREHVRRVVQVLVGISNGAVPATALAAPLEAAGLWLASGVAAEVLGLCREACHVSGKGEQTLDIASCVAWICLGNLSCAERDCSTSGSAAPRAGALPGRGDGRKRGALLGRPTRSLPRRHPVPGRGHESMLTQGRPVVSRASRSSLPCHMCRLQDSVHLRYHVV